MKQFSLRHLSVLIPALLVTGVSGLRAELVENPFADRIPKSNVTIELKPMAEGLAAAVWLTHAGDNSGRLFVVDQAGQIRVLRDGKLLDEPFLDVTDRLIPLRKGFDERGLLGLAFHPGYADKNSPGFGRFYTYSSEKIEGNADFTVDMTVAGQKLPFDHQSVITEWQASAQNPDRADPASRRPVLRVDEPQFNHDGGCVAFGPDQMLYVVFGDGGAGNDFGPGHTQPQGNGQDTSNILGSIIRIDPLGKTGAKSANGQYSVPADNPLVGKDGLDEIWAWGLRNPWRMSFDMSDGRLIAADVGQEYIEEINIIRRGGNYGWRLKEGPYYFSPTAPRGKNISTEAPAGISIPETVDPVAMYDHDDGVSITGGFVYRGKAIPALQGLYIFGDWNQVVSETDDKGKKKNRPLFGRLLAADLSGGKITELKIGADDRRLGEYIPGFGQDAEGEIYVLTSNGSSPLSNEGGRGTGSRVWKIIPAK